MRLRRICKINPINLEMVRPTDELVETPDLADFNFTSKSRITLIEEMKNLSMTRGFKSIIPISDKNTGHGGIKTTFGCNMSGVTMRKLTTRCPFRMEYKKEHEHAYFVLKEMYPYHNHTLNQQFDLNGNYEVDFYAPGGEFIRD